MLRPHVVILGAGFGGTYVGKKLSSRVNKGELDVTIVNSTNYFLFTPLLHEVATGALSPRSVAEPLREIFAGTGVRIIQGSAASIDVVSRNVKIRDASTGISCDVGYDYLVIATGAETNYYGIPGAEGLAMPLKSLADAAAVRNRVIDAFERAILVSDPALRRNILSFAVVGGGPTGVEVAAELSGLVKGMVERYYGGDHCRPGEDRQCLPEEPSITLVNASKELLEQFAPSLRAAALERLHRNGVAVESGVTVSSVSKNGLVVSGQRTIPASIVIWAAGVKPVVPKFEGAAPTMAGNRLSVDSSFRVMGMERIFALGDAAAYVDPHGFASDSKNVRPLPMLAQVAVAESRVVAKNVIMAVEGKTLVSLDYHSKGSMVSVGQWFAIGEIFSMKLAGKLAWWLWRTVYLFKFASWRKRVRIAFEWAFELISPRDITKI